jgi:hypothetical protein
MGKGVEGRVMVNFVKSDTDYLVKEVLGSMKDQGEGERKGVFIPVGEVGEALAQPGVA